MLPEPPDDFVREGGFPGAAGSGQADDGAPAACLCTLFDVLAEPRPGLAELERRDDARQRAVVARLEPVQTSGQRTGKVEVGPPEHVVDHALQAQLLAVFGRVDARDAVVVEFPNFLRHDDAAAAAEDLDVRRPSLREKIDHVLEELDVPALVGADRDAVGILLNGRRYHLVDRAVMAEVNDFSARRLKDSPHDVDRGIMAVEQAGGRHETQRTLRHVAPAGRPLRLRRRRTALRRRLRRSVPVPALGLQFLGRSRVFQQGLSSATAFEAGCS